MKIKYSLNDSGIVYAIGFDESLQFDLDENTPFQTIEEAMYWRMKDGQWQRYDPTWMDEKFNVRVTIPSDVVLMNDGYLQLKSWVLYLQGIERALYELTGGNVIMYFIDILPDHLHLLQQDTNVLIEHK